MLGRVRLKVGSPAERSDIRAALMRTSADRGLAQCPDCSYMLDHANIIS